MGWNGFERLAKMAALLPVTGTSTPRVRLQPGFREAIDVRGNASLSTDQIQVELRRIQEQTRTAIGTVLGPKAADSLFEKPAAKSWIDDLTRQPKPKK